MTKEMPEVSFKGWRCLVEEHRYTNGRTALELVDATDGEPVATATVNIPEAELAPNEVLVKSYSENAGMLEALEQAGIVKRTGEWVDSGFVRVPKCRLMGR